MSVFLISLVKSRILLFRPKADDLRPWIFQDEIVKVLRSIKCPIMLVVWFGLRPVSVNRACRASGTCHWLGLVSRSLSLSGCWVGKY